jgi:transposase-like protein
VVSEIGGFSTPCLSAWQDLGERSDGPEEEHVRTTGCQAQRAAQRPLNAEEKYQIWQQLLTGELTRRQAAEQWNVDPTTIMRIRRVGREGALTALAQSKPGRRDGSGGQDAELGAARAEIARLEETVKEQAIELVALWGKTRSGW